MTTKLHKQLQTWRVRASVTPRPRLWQGNELYTLCPYTCQYCTALHSLSGTRARNILLCGWNCAHHNRQQRLIIVRFLPAKNGTTQLIRACGWSLIVLLLCIYLEYSYYILCIRNGRLSCMTCTNVPRSAAVPKYLTWEMKHLLWMHNMQMLFCYLCKSSLENLAPPVYSTYNIITSPKSICNFTIVVGVHINM